MNEDKLTDPEQRKILIRYWMDKSEESLASAIDEFKANRLSTCVRAAYYACFYAFSAVLWNEGKVFKKHSAVRGALHRDFVKNSRLNAKWGRFYDIIFDSRQRGDYQPLVEFEPEQVERFIENSKGFVEQMRKLIEE
ncbi:HEPN domain-containing protein [Desulfobacterales bacterium HSG16]|nr:HEPN domain-containing protein [Desulfobacterales bacterium HSG16]